MDFTYISSRANPLVVTLSKLGDKKARSESGLFLAEGEKLCREALGRVTVKYALVLGDKGGADKSLLKLAGESGGEIIVLSEGAFSKISQDNTPDGVIFACLLPDTGAAVEKCDKVVMLDSVRDPGNVGTVIRSAAAFGFDSIILCASADAFQPKAVRASMGALFKMKLTVCGEPCEIIEKMKADGRRIVAAALSNDNMTLGESELFGSDCPVIGNEGHGVSKEVLALSDKTIKIPMSGKTESLNASAAAAVILWEYGKIGGGLKGDER